MAVVTTVLIGIFFGSIIWSLQNAIGSWIFGLLLGFQFNFFSFWGMMVLKENGKLKFRFTNFSIDATCGMKGANRTFSKQAAWDILVWVMGVAVLIPIWIMTKKPDTTQEYIKLGIPLGMSALYLYQLKRLIQLMVQMFGKGEKSILWREKQEAMNRLDEGVRPRDLRLQYERSTPVKKSDAMYIQYELLKYYSELDAKRYGQLEKYIREFEQYIPAVWNAMDTPYYYETLFYYCCIAGDMQRAASIMSAVRDVLVADKDVNGRRVYAYYLYYSGKDKNIALQTAREGLQAVDAFNCKGIAYMEKELLQDLIYRIQSA